MFTQLKDRAVWYDGEISVVPDMITQFLIHGVDRVHVTEIDADVAQYNQLVDQPITVKTTVNPLNVAFVLPYEYQNLDVETYVLDRLDDYKLGPLHDSRLQRVIDELVAFKTHNLYDLLRALIYTINTLTEKNIVWGIGRGSSVSSYVLFLIGVHDVDSVKYALEFTDFIR